MEEGTASSGKAEPAGSPPAPTTSGARGGVPAGDLALRAERAVEELQNSLLFFRLPALPPEILSLITRAAGRLSRRASKSLLDAYGPLDCGLRLDGPDALASILATASRDQRHYHRIRSLKIRLPRTAATNSLAAAGACSDFIAALPDAFPQLRSLCLPTCSQQEAALLAPLHSCLASLTIPASYALSSALRHMQPLTNLRSLTITGRPNEGIVQEVVSELNQLPQLRRLHLFDLCTPLPSTAAHLSSLSCGSTLTHLACGLTLVNWDEPEVSALCRGLPNLQTLAFSMGGSMLHTPIPMDSILAALSALAALTALHLSLTYMCPRCTFHALASLQLASFTARIGHGCDAASLMGALSGQAALTQLRLTGGSCINERSYLTSGHLQRLTKLAGSLQHLELGVWVAPSAYDLMECVLALTRLTALALSRLPETPGWSPTGVEHLTRLRSLVVLKVEDNAYGFGEAVVRVLPGVTGLMELELRGAPAYIISAQHVGDREVWEALPLLPNLTRLALLKLPHVVGPAYGALRRMPGLKQLQLRNGPADSRLLYLLPLPPSLQSIQLFYESEAEVQRVSRDSSDAVDALREAARKQACAPAIAVWDQYKVAWVGDQ